MEALESKGTHTNVVCPDCGGSMKELAAHVEGVENQLYGSLRAIDELTFLTQRLLDQARADQRTDTIESLEHRLSRTANAGRALRVLLDDVE